MWRTVFDRRTQLLLQLAEKGVCGVRDTFRDHPGIRRTLSEQIAAEAINWYEARIDKPMMVYDVLWRYAFTADTRELEKHYRASLLASRASENSGGIHGWAVPTLIQFCCRAELIRRRAWSAESKEKAYQITRTASDHLGLLAKAEFDRAAKRRIERRHAFERA